MFSYAKHSVVFYMYTSTCPLKLGLNFHEILAHLKSINYSLAFLKKCVHVGVFLLMTTCGQVHELRNQLSNKVELRIQGTSDRGYTFI